MNPKTHVNFGNGEATIRLWRGYAKVTESSLKIPLINIHTVDKKAQRCL